MGHAFGLRLPAIVLSASLAYFAWLDTFPLVPHPYHAPSREQSQSQIDGWMVEDIELYNSPFHSRSVTCGPGCPDSPSTCHDWDCQWLRTVAGDPLKSLFGDTAGFGEHGQQARHEEEEGIDDYGILDDEGFAFPNTLHQTPFRPFLKHFFTGSLPPTN